MIPSSRPISAAVPGPEARFLAESGEVLPEVTFYDADECFERCYGR
jgi:hypothetical protein